MPRIDDIDLKKRKFKKNKVRSWDDDLATSLKIDAEKPLENAPIVEKEKIRISKSSSIKEGSSQPNQAVKPEDKKVSQEQSNQEPQDLQLTTSITTGPQKNPNKYVKRYERTEHPKETSSTSVKQTNRELPSLNDISFLDESFRYKKLLKRLRGIERRIFLLVVNICNQKGTLRTGSISSEDLDSHLSINRNSRETAVKRLVKKDLIKRLSGKTGIYGALNMGVSQKVLDLANHLLEAGELLD